ncbi:MAG: cytochrome D1 domain-containing protein [Hyphomicrobiales bacterium]
MIRHLLALVLFAAWSGAVTAAELRGSGDLGIVIERAAGAIQIIETTGRTSLARVDGLGDLSHASAVFSRDGRYAYIFGRDGGLSKIDLLTAKLVKRVVQAGNSIGGAISDDGRLVAVSNYKPGGVKVFDAETLGLVADIPATYGSAGERSKVVGLVDAPGGRFVFTLYDAGEIWIADMPDGGKPGITKFEDIGELPYDALITGDGRHYIAGLFGEDGLAHVDLWAAKPQVRRILGNYGRGEKKLPVYKMPHLEGWAKAGDRIFLPAIGRHEILVLDAFNFEEVGRIPVHGQPIFAVARPDGRQIWVNFAHPLNDTVQVIDVPSLKVVHEFTPGKAVLHLEFTPRGENVWISVRDADRVDVYDTQTFERLKALKMDKPSGIFLTARANRIGL